VSIFFRIVARRVPVLSPTIAMAQPAVPSSFGHYHWAKRFQDELERCLGSSEYNFLNLSIGVQEAHAIKVALAASPPLQIFSVEGKPIPHAAVVVLMDSFRSMARLSTLSLTRTSIGTEGGKLVAGLLPTQPTLKTLNLNQNSIGPEGTSLLIECVPRLHALRTLNLDYNNVRVQGAERLAEFLRQNVPLKTLSVATAEIGVTGVIAISNALLSNSHLQSLDVGQNLIGVAGATALAEALRVNSTLTSLNIRGNNIGDEGIKILSLALRNNCGLKSLEIKSNTITATGIKDLAAALQVNQTLQSLNVTGNNPGVDGVKAMEGIARHNTSLISLTGFGQRMTGLSTILRNMTTANRRRLSEAPRPATTSTPELSPPISVGTGNAVSVNVSAVHSPPDSAAANGNTSFGTSSSSSSSPHGSSSSSTLEPQSSGRVRSATDPYTVFVNAVLAPSPDSSASPQSTSARTSSSFVGSPVPFALQDLGSPTQARPDSSGADKRKRPLDVEDFQPHQQLQCAICLESLTANRPCAVQCGHIFHERCIHPVLRVARAICPLCRRPIAAPALRLQGLEA